MSFIIFIIILLVLVLVHEFGHFFTAKKLGIRVDEFGFGFPPRLFGIKKGETVYSINALPIGGFVKIYGENGEEDLVVGVPLGTPTTKLDSSRSFVNKPKWQQAIVLFAGVAMNFLLAWILFSIGFMSGLPTSVGSEPAGLKLTDVNLTVVSVYEKSPASLAGLKTGDKIVTIASGDDYILDLTPETLKSFVLSHSDKKINLGYVRGQDKVFHSASVTPAVNKTDNRPEIGISMDIIGTAKLPFLKALIEGMRLNWFVTKGTAIGLYTLARDNLHGKADLSSVEGPIGIVAEVGDAYQFGFVYLLSLAALISINLAIINLLPFPALDGGRLLFLLIEKIKGSRINPKYANTANTVGFGILILLMIVITWHDVVKLF